MIIRNIYIYCARLAWRKTSDNRLDVGNVQNAIHSVRRKKFYSVGIQQPGSKRRKQLPNRSNSKNDPDPSRHFLESFPETLPNFFLDWKSLHSAQKKKNKINICCPA